MSSFDTCKKTFAGDQQLSTHSEGGAGGRYMQSFFDSSENFASVQQLSTRCADGCPVPSGRRLVELILTDAMKRSSSVSLFGARRKAFAGFGCSSNLMEHGRKTSPTANGIEILRAARTHSARNIRGEALRVLASEKCYMQ